MLTKVKSDWFVSAHAALRNESCQEKRRQYGRLQITNLDGERHIYKIHEMIE